MKQAALGEDFLQQKRSKTTQVKCILGWENWPKAIPGLFPTSALETQHIYDLQVTS